MKRLTLWPEIRLDRAPAAPTLRQQIERQIATAVRDGRLTPGCRLPSSRLLAKALNVSRGTVVDAYGTLCEDGLVVALAGSGMCVAATSPNAPALNNLRRTAAAAHYPADPVHLEDPDGTPVYLNPAR